MSEHTLIFLEPRSEYDPMIVGVKHDLSAVVYDKDKIIEYHMELALRDDPGISSEDAFFEALDHVEYNVIGEFLSVKGGIEFISYSDYVVLMEQLDGDGNRALER